MTEVKTQPRKYTLAEIEEMRRALSWMLTPSGQSYNPVEKNAQIEDQLRTHMQNGTEPSELQEALSRHISAEQDRHKAEQLFYEEQRAKAPPPRVLKTKHDPAEGHGRNDECPVAATGGDAPSPGISGEDE